MGATLPRTSVKALKQLATAARKRGVAEGLAQCHDSTGAYFERKEAATLEHAAQAALTLPESPMLGVGAEALLQRYPDPEDASAGAYFKDTLEIPTLVTARASFDRMQLALDVGCLEEALDTAETIQARNSLEKMLAGQLAAAHHTAMTLLAKSLGRVNTESRWAQAEMSEACRLATTAARFMSVFQEGLLTLAKLRTGGKQTVVVQHVYVTDGGQAVVTGDLTTGGASTVGGQSANGGTTPCPTTSRRPGRRRAAVRKLVRAPHAASPPSVANDAAGSTADAALAPRKATTTP